MSRNIRPCTNGWKRTTRPMATARLKTATKEQRASRRVRQAFRFAVRLQLVVLWGLRVLRCRISAFLCLQNGLSGILTPGPVYTIR